MRNFEFDDIAYRLPTFDTPMPADPEGAAIIEAAEEAVAGCAALYGMFALQKTFFDDLKLMQLLGEDLATIDESLTEDACFDLTDDDEDRPEIQRALDDVQRVIEERHILAPQLTEYRASIIGGYREKLMKILMDPEMDGLYIDDAIGFWEDLLESDPMSVIERAFDEAQISVEQDLIALANPEQALRSN